MDLLPCAEETFKISPMSYHLAPNKLKMCAAVQLFVLLMFSSSHLVSAHYSCRYGNVTFQHHCRLQLRRTPVPLAGRVPSLARQAAFPAHEHEPVLGWECSTWTLTHYTTGRAFGQGDRHTSRPSGSGRWVRSLPVQECNKSARLEKSLPCEVNDGIRAQHNKMKSMDDVKKTPLP